MGRPKIPESERKPRKKRNGPGHSTGPRTLVGKSIACGNNIRSGLYSRDPYIRAAARLIEERKIVQEIALKILKGEPLNRPLPRSKRHKPDSELTPEELAIRQQRRERIRQTRPWEKTKGPVTEIGKAMSGLTALRHGLYATSCPEKLRELQAKLADAEGPVQSAIPLLNKIKHNDKKKREEEKQSVRKRAGGEAVVALPEGQGTPAD